VLPPRPDSMSANTERQRQEAALGWLLEVRYLQRDEDQ